MCRAQWQLLHEARSLRICGPFPQIPHSLDISLVNHFLLNLCSPIIPLSDLSGSSVILELHFELGLAG